MNSTKMLFIISLLGILILIILAQNAKKIESGIVKSITQSNKKITIKLENRTEELIIFDAFLPKIKKGNIIKFQGKKELYKNREQIVVDKLFIKK